LDVELRFGSEIFQWKLVWWNFSHLTLVNNILMTISKIDLFTVFPRKKLSEYYSNSSAKSR
jgi:hypothetical protein